MSNLATITNNILADSGIDDINVIVSTGSYANPAWITSLAWTKITGAPLGDYLPLVGGTMTGNINWAQTDRGITWSFNTDGASIKFYNTGDGDTDSRLEFATVDNNNEYFRWVHIPDGGTLYESMRLVPNSSGNAQLLVSGSAGIGTNSITNGTTFGGGGQVNRLKVQSSNYTALEINSSTSGGSIQFTYGTNLPNQVSGLIGYNYANGTVNEFSISNVLSGPMVFATTNVEAMRIFAGRNVHIGPTPVSDNGARLQVSGAGTFTGTGLLASVRINNTTASTGKDWHLYSLNNGNFGLYNNTDGSYAYQVTPSGNLGLGVTPSAWNSAYKAMQFGTTGAIFGESGDAANYFTTNTFVDSVGFKYITSDWALGYFQENGVHSWRNAPSGTAGNAISFTQAMTLDSSGRLGIGTPNPGKSLDIVTNVSQDGIRITGSSNPRLTIIDSTNNVQFDALTTDTEAVIRTDTNHPLHFTTNGALKMSITSGGNVLIGNPPASDNGARLQVSGEGRFYQPLTNTTSYLTVENNRARNAAIRLKTTVGDFYLGTGIGADVNQFQIFDGTAGANRLTISSTGAATFSSNVTTTGGFLQFPNNYGVEGRNVANTAHRTVLKLNTSNQIEIGRDTDISSIILGTASAVNAMTITSAGSVTMSSLAGSGNRIVVANSGGTLISAVIGSGLAFDGTTLTATGGGSGSISGSGTSGTVALFTGSTSIGNSAITQSGSTVGITSGITDSVVTFTNSTAYSTSNNYSLTYRSTTASFGIQPIANIIFDTVGDAASRIRFVTRANAPDYDTRMVITSNGTIGFNGNSGVGNAGLDKMSMGYLNSNYGWIQTWSGTPLLLNPSGNPVIIGSTSNNGARLQVSGEVNINSGATRGLRIDTNNGVQGISLSPNSIFGVDEPGVGNGRFIINTSGNVGIANNSPSFRLDVSGTGRYLQNNSSVGNATGITLQQSGSGDIAISYQLTGSREFLMGIDNSDSDTFKINHITGSSDFNNVGLAITTAGNVGIGTNNPTSRLTIAPPQVTNASSLEFIGTDNAAISAYYSLTIAVNNSNTQSGRVINFSKGGKGYGDQASTMMSIIADTGNVLIGAVSDVNAKLFVNGDIRTGALDGGYVAGYWKLGRAVIGTQPSETYQIIVEINGQLYSIGAANI